MEKTKEPKVAKEVILVIKSKSKGTTQEVTQKEWAHMTKLGHNVHFQVIEKK